jgi:hypothetical protein
MRWGNNTLEGKLKELVPLQGKRILLGTPEMRVCHSHTQILLGTGQEHLNHSHKVYRQDKVWELLNLKCSRTLMGK